MSTGNKSDRLATINKKPSEADQRFPGMEIPQIFGFCREFCWNLNSYA